METIVNVGRKEKLNYAIIDSQIVKTVTYRDKRGIDGGKNERQETTHCSRCSRMSTVC